MSGPNKLTAKLSSEVLSRYQPSNDCQKLIGEDELPPQSVEKLSTQGNPFDLVQFLCHGLGARDSIFFGLKCLELRNEAWTQIERLALAVSRDWVFDPDEASRIRAHQLSARLGLRSGPSWLAEAVFWNGSGSISGADEDSLLPPEHLYASSVCAAIATSAALPPWPKGSIGMVGYYEEVKQIGREVAGC